VKEREVKHLVENFLCRECLGKVLAFWEGHIFNTEDSVWDEVLDKQKTLWEIRRAWEDKN